jgi:hypothetical protein
LFIIYLGFSGSVYHKIKHWMQPSIILLLILLIVIEFSLPVTAKDPRFVTTKGKDFYLEGKKYFYVGTNYW